MSAPLLEIITIGREILDGRVTDTNSVFIGQELGKLGIAPRFGQRVDDSIERIVQAFEIAQTRSHFVLVTGGLGPTEDDLSARAFAEFCGHALAENAEALAQVIHFFEVIKRPMIELQKKQALLPTGVQVLRNERGSAPGFSLSHTGVQWFFMPGVPAEMKMMLTKHVLPKLPAQENYRSHSWYTQFTSEGDLQKRLGEVLARLPKDWELSFRTHFPENHIGLLGSCAGAASRTQLFDELVLQISRALGDDVFSSGPAAQTLEQGVVQNLIAKNFRIASVESCTGGPVASRLTDIPGSSQSFWASWVCYDNKAKQALGVSPELLDSHGAVSPEVAARLAELGLLKLRQMMDAQAGAKTALCVSTSGIAGPTGGSTEKPVGLCYVALAPTDRETEVIKVQGRPGLSRAQNKLLFSQKALEIVRRRIL